MTIAQVNFLIIGNYNAFFESRVHPYLSNFTSVPDIIVYCRIVSTIERPIGKVITKRNDRTFYYSENGGYSYYHSFEDSDQPFLDVQFCSSTIFIKILDFAGNPQFDFTYPVLNATDEAIRYPLLQFDSIVLHASAIAYQNQGIAFSAPSGTGKTTQTSLWLDNTEATLVNDDSPIIRLIDGTPTLFGSPWAGSTGMNTNMCVPLKAIVFIEQNDFNTIEKLNSQQVLQRILTEVVKPKDRDLLEKTIDILGLVIARTDCYLLKCTPDIDAMKLVKKTLFSKKISSIA